MFLDAVLIVILSTPALYFFLFRSLVKEVSERKRKEAELIALNDTLEHRVAKRTVSLEKLSEELKHSLLDSEERNRTISDLNENMASTLLELNRTQDQLVHSEKMASIGKLAAGIAHEINTPIGYIQSNTKALGEYFTDLITLVDQYHNGLNSFDLDEALTSREQLNTLKENIEARKNDIDLDFLIADAKHIVSETNEGTARVTNIINDLMEFSHDDTQEEAQPLDLNLWLNNTINLASSDLKDKTSIHKDYGDIPFIKGHQHQLCQVFLHLLINASQAIDDEGVIDVRTFVNQSNACIEISDTGRGIPNSIQNRIFEPFFTTQDFGDGTGLGLFIAFNIIKKHNGLLSVTSEEGKGSTFTISLPI